MTETHFAKRMAERYPQVQDPSALHFAIEAAIKAERWDLIDHVFDMPKDAAIYRAQDVSGTIVYVLTRKGRITTALTAAHVKRYRRIRANKQMRGNRQRQPKV